MIIAPSILSADFSILKEEIKTILEAEWIHIDIMDGHFVPNLTIGPDVVKSIRKHSKQVFDTHLMIDEPEKYVDPFIEAGSDHITFHIETDTDHDALIDYLHEKDVKAGLSIKPNTSIQTIQPYLHKLDIILVMSVEPGFGGQSFIEPMVEKMKKLSRLRKENDYHYKIVVDGGINAKTAKQCKDAGVDVLVAGSYIFKANDRLKAIRCLK